MNITNIPQRLEIAFWAMVISVMKETLRLRFVLPRLSRLLTIVHTLVWAMTGLVLGFALGYVTRLVW